MASTILPHCTGLITPVRTGLPNQRRCSRYAPILALSLIALASAGCAKAPLTKDEVLARAKDEFAKEQYGKAEQDFREVLRQAPDDRLAMRQLAIIYHDQGQLPQAYGLLKKAAELDPDDLDVQLKLGLTLLTVGE